MLIFLQKNRMFLGIGIIALGFIMCYWGNKYINYVFILLCGLITMHIGLIVYEITIKGNSTANYTWLVLLGSFIVGGLLAFFLTSFPTLISIIIALFLGFTLSNLIYQFLLGLIHVAKPEIIKYITLTLCLVLCAYIAFKYRQGLFVIATSLIGSYGFIRGISLYAGKFPNEDVIIKLIEKKEFTELSEVKIKFNFFKNILVVFRDNNIILSRMGCIVYIWSHSSI